MRSILDRFWNQPPRLTRLTGAALFAFSLFMTLGALYFQHFRGLQPCELCMWQRYGHRAVIIFAFFSILSAPHRKLSLWILGLMCLSVAGAAAVAFFHTGVELQWWKGLAHCSTPACDGITDVNALLQCMQTAPRCDKIPWEMWGLSMAAWNGVATTAALIFALVMTGRIWWLWRKPAAR